MHLELVCGAELQGVAGRMRILDRSGCFLQNDGTSAMMGTMLFGFDEWDADVDDGVSLYGRSGGSGPPVVLLHGHPHTHTHTTWYRVLRCL